jgi:hypothetical protein
VAGVRYLVARRTADTRRMGGFGGEWPDRDAWVFRLQHEPRQESDSFARGDERLCHLESLMR